MIFVKRFSLGAFPELRKATVSFFISGPSVRVEKLVPPHWRSLFDFGFWGYFSKVCRGN